MTRVALYILAAVAGIALCVACWLVLTSPARERAKANEARGGQVVAEGGQAAAHDAMTASETAAEAARASQAITEANHAEILAAPGSGASVGPVSDAGLRALCLRNAYRADPRCRAMRSAGS